jgi:hypothetical protein
MFKIMRMLRKLPVNLLDIGNTNGQFLDYFKDFDKVEAVKGIFGEKTTEVLTNLKVEFSWLSGYMYVDGDDGHIVISKKYLNTATKPTFTLT